MAGAAAIISLAPVAHADDLTPLLDLSTDATPVNTDPLGLLGEAGAKFTQADAVLNEVPAVGTPDETQFVNVQLADVQFQLNGLPLSGPDAPDVGGQLAELQTAEATILAYDGGALDSYVSPLFVNLDTNWLQGSEALLTADQAFETAATTGSTPIPAELAVFAADLNLLGSAANSVSIDWASSLLGGNAGGAAEAASASTALASANADDPAVFYYSADPTNVFSPVYTITPTGAEDVISTDASGDVVGTQEFTVSYFGIPLDTFNGGVEYSPVSSPLDPFGGPYVEDISTLGATGTLIPDNTGFLAEEFGGGYGYLTDVANITGTSPTVGDFILTPFGPENITNFVNEFLNLAGSVTGTASAVDPSSFVDLLSSIGL